MKNRYKIILSYDGTLYAGWQVQKNAQCIQPIVQNALETICRHPIDLTGAGRTDAGVHALGQTAHYSIDNTIPLPRLHKSVNALLPADIQVRSIEEVSDDFHARYSAKGKIYHYHLHLDKYPDPFKRRYAAHVSYPVDLALLQKACTYFEGTHDFTSFAHRAQQGSAAQDAVRTIYRLNLVEEPGGIRLEFEGNGFLYKMVRNIVGTLLDIAAGKISLEEIPEIIAAKDRSKAGKTAPPQGLFLVHVDYTNSSKEV